MREGQARERTGIEPGRVGGGDPRLLPASLDDEPPEPGVLGDVVLCAAVAERQAATAGHSTHEELDLLAAHGILHLLGYDHAEPDEEREMFGLQTRLLSGWQAQARRPQPS